jgi:hypothetical protein
MLVHGQMVVQDVERHALIVDLRLTMVDQALCLLSNANVC